MDEASPDKPIHRMRRAPSSNFANMLVHSTASRYQLMVERAQSGLMDAREWRWDVQGRGIWVSQKWIWE